mmetsp:Transcript_11648/g.18019  ORF Transcript_11648/g.18019 Transcript_11648/m.18019 type:complete len:364 (-) Transcript_11648:2396-3487(-)
MKSSRGTVYPQTPSGSTVLARIPASELTVVDRSLVMISSLIFVGSPIWVPSVYAWAWNKWKKIPKEDKKRKAIYFSFLMSTLAVAIFGPHRHRKVGKWLNVRNWSLWKSWLRFIAFEVIQDQKVKKDDNIKDEQAILAVIPHGIFPFSLAFAALPIEATRVFGYFRPVVATATALFPFVRTFLGWLGAVDASRTAVDQALVDGARIGVAPGGIAEMFEGYPKPLTHPDDEYAILRSRKGFVRMAVKHGVPLVPVYCFGATKMLKRLQLPALFENISKLLRISLCLFFGPLGLPVPFRQKLMYVMGRPLYPSHIENGTQPPVEGSPDFDRQVDALHSRFCDELLDLFERHKESYGWAHKTMRLI